MGTNWTEEQKQVIEERGKDLLVSAAAGSGKTAVLTERIISLITDREHPADIDRMLVLTFTEAAAGEMKDRIGKALRRILEEEPDNEAVRRQSIFIDHAHISTVHSFCSYVIRNYFHSTGIDPAYRVMDEAESALLMSDFMEDFLEEKYEARDAGLLFLVRTFFIEKNADSRLLELIKKVHEFAEAAPWPEKWLSDAVKKWEDACTPEGLEKFLKGVTENAYGEIRAAFEETKELLAVAESEGGPAGYLPALVSDLTMYEEFLKAKTFEERKAAADRFAFAALSNKKSKGEDPALRESVRTARNRLRGLVSAVRDEDYSLTAEELRAEMEYCLPIVRAVCRLTEAFGSGYREAKRAKGVMDFSDMEHYALDILVKRDEDGRAVPTEAARELAAYFDTVMTDEYQDTNEVQELILSSVSGGKDGVFNRFMVGDIKQAVYGFRHARPEIFLEKYNGFAGADETHKRIDLNKNFRSSKNVIDTINFLFRKLMSESVGGIVYDENAELKCGRESGSANFRSEILILDKKDPYFAEHPAPDQYAQAEAAMIASRIKSLMKTMTVIDADTKEERPLQYRDCAILLRSVSGVSGTYLKVLQAAGIPSYSTQREGYFAASEVTAVLDYLRVLDNPLQDIPLTAVLFSPMGGFTASELARIRTFGSGSFSRLAREYAESGDHTGLRDRLSAFFARIDCFREKIPYTPVNALIREILEVTGFGVYAAAMPGGEQRAANLEMLVDKARSFEKKGDKGLFLFIRYIEQMQKTGVDFGEAGICSGGTDAVPVISVHKSKGLEYPVVFLAGCGKQFNKTDLNAPVLLHYDHGIGIDAKNAAGFSVKKTMYKKAVRLEAEKDLCGEELRILYVALTRAKDKLIITGTVPDLTKAAADCARQKSRWKGTIPATDLLRAKGFMEWIFMALAGDACFEPVYRWAGIRGVSADSDCGTVDIRIESAGKGFEGLTREKNIEAARIGSLPEPGEKKIYSREAREMLSDLGAYEYPHRGSENIPAKVSVSELKRLAYEADEGDKGEAALPEKTVFPYIPKFMKKEESGLSAAERGTAFHKLLENLDLAALGAGDISRDEALDAALRTADELLEKGLFSKEERDAIDLFGAADFILSDIARRMRLADCRGELKREMPFTMSVPAHRIRPETDSCEPVLIQGIIDAYFPENGRYVIVDYKTDRGKTAEELARLYEKQLRYYAEAVERSTGGSADELIIYSVGLGTEVRI